MTHATEATEQAQQLQDRMSTVENALQAGLPRPGSRVEAAAVERKQHVREHRRHYPELSNIQDMLA